MKTKPTSLTQAELREWLTYDPDTGVFRWRKQPAPGKPPGTIAGSVQTQHGRKRRMLWVQGQRMYASRAAFTYVHGDLPDRALIDHADGNSLNDRIANLRMASATQNVWNRIQREGVTRATGVSKDARGRFKARIQVPAGQKVNLGTWDTEAEAHACYMGAAAILHSEFWIGLRPDHLRDAAEVLEVGGLTVVK